GVDAHVAPHGADGAEQLGAVGRQPVERGLEAVGVAGLGEQLARLGGVVLVARHVLGVAQVGGRQVGVGGRGEAAPDHLGDQLAVESVHQGAAHAHVVEGRHAGVDVDAVRAGGGDLAGADVRVRLQRLVDLGVLQVHGDVDLAAL